MSTSSRENSLGPRRQGLGKRHVLPDNLRNLVVLTVGEFFGTFMFLLLAFVGTQAALDTNDPSDPNAPLMPFSLLYIAASFGCSLAVNVWVFYRVTGGMFNPAVTLGLLLVGAVSPIRALCIVPAQLVAGIAAAAVTDGLLPGPLGVANALSNGTSIVQGLFLEMFLTAQLVLTVYFLAVEKHRSTFLAPIGIGISVFIAHIAGTNFTGTSINPARSFGPAVITGFVGYHWIYWLGPCMGAVLSFAVYSLMKWLEYHTANPGQDAGDVESGKTLLPSGPLSPVAVVESEGKPRPTTGRNDSVMDGQVHHDGVSQV
jgi:aquaporin related protein